MRIAVVTNLPTHYRTPLFERVAERVTFDLYFTSGGGEWYWSRRAHLSVGSLTACTITEPATLARALRSGGYDAIVTSLVGRSTLVATVATAKLTQTPLVVWVGIWQHPQTVFHRVTRPAVRWIYRHADALLVYGTHVRTYIERESGRRDAIVELPQAIDNDRFRQEIPAGEVASARDLFAPIAPRGLYVGRLEHGKGLEILLDALAQTKVAQSVTLVGGGSLRTSLAARTESLGLGNRIRFVDHMAYEHLPAVFRAADFLVLPSVTTRRFKEPWGLVVNEAMNSKLPVIATNAVGAAVGGLLVDRVTGLVVPEQDVGALARAMDALAGDPHHRRQAAAAGHERVSNWNFDTAADALVEGVELAVSRGRR